MSQGQGRVELASVGSRFLAQVLDLVWMLPLSVLLNLVAAVVNGGPMSDGGLLMAHLVSALIVLNFWVERQGTPGKLVLGLRIVDAESGGPAPVGNLVVRYVGFLIALMPLGLGCLWALWDPRRQGWHDKMARTLVVRG
jgi:uncharacterized RDD family membrane protein YckC